MSDLVKIVDKLKNIDNKINNYLAVKDSIIDEDVIEVLDDNFKLIKSFRSISQYIIKKRVEYFIKGLTLDK